MTEAYDWADNARGCYNDAIRAMRLEKVRAGECLPQPGDAEEIEASPLVTDACQIGECTLYCGDCLEVLPLLGKVDAVVTDPPYGIDEANGKNASRDHLAKAKDYGRSCWDKEPASAETIRLMVSNSKWQIVFGGNFYSFPPTSCWLVWDKLNSGDFADCELAWTNLPKAVRRLQYHWNGCMRKERDVARQHPTQKPIGVMKWCIEHLPADAQTILDPFLGSGTTGVACVKLGRRFIGIEIDQNYFQIACKRIEEAYRQPDMFVEAAKPKAEQLSLMND